jgi:plastocyanin domain-containing protein
MGIDKIIVLAAAIGLIGIIIWWFFGSHGGDAVAATVEANEQSVEIIVDGGYTPNVITLQKGIPAKLIFLRKDPSGCLEEVVIPDFGISSKLPINKPHVINITPKEAGEFKYACGMNMFFGKVVVT